MAFTFQDSRNVWQNGSFETWTLKVTRETHTGERTCTHPHMHQGETTHHPWHSLHEETFRRDEGIPCWQIQNGGGGGDALPNINTSRLRVLGTSLEGVAWDSEKRWEGVHRVCFYCQATKYISGLKAVRGSSLWKETRSGATKRTLWYSTAENSVQWEKLWSKHRPYSQNHSQRDEWSDVYEVLLRRSFVLGSGSSSGGVILGSSGNYRSTDLAGERKLLEAELEGDSHLSFLPRPFSYLSWSEELSPSTSSCHDDGLHKHVGPGDHELNSLTLGARATLCSLLSGIQSDENGNEYKWFLPHPLESAVHRNSSNSL